MSRFMETLIQHLLSPAYLPRKARQQTQTIQPTVVACLEFVTKPATPFAPGRLATIIRSQAPIAQLVEQLTLNQ